MLGLIAVTFVLNAGLSFLVPFLSLSLVRWLVLGLTLAVGTLIVTFGPGTRPRAGVQEAYWAAGAVVALWGITVPISESILLSTLKWGAMVAQVVIFVYLGVRLLSIADWKTVFVCSFFFLCVPVVLAGVSLLLGQNPLRPYPMYVQGRLAAVTGPNTLGLVTALSGVAALWMQEGFARRTWKRRLVVSFLGLSVLELYLTGSRTAALAFAGGSIVWAIATHRTAWIVLFVGLVGAFFAFTEPEPVRSTARYELERGIREDPFRTDVLTKSRDQVWATSYESWAQKPWFGYGYGRTGQDFTLRSVTRAVTAVRDGSGYLGLLESVGAIGTLALLFLYGVLTRYIWDGIWAWRAGRRDVRVWVLLTGGTFVAALAVHAGGEPWIIGPGSFMHVFFWASIAAVMAARSDFWEDELLRMQQQH
ncbi:O-antigen ligase family protein [Salinibacter ruber]|uniref:O-antigen ligase family protein n=1 Tax=Salinibacter ruber TaxID=146919 RepID=UPI002167A494|nr:O-antigen ligase [Salinibacter ruber]